MNRKNCMMMQSFRESSCLVTCLCRESIKSISQHVGLRTRFRFIFIKEGKANWLHLTILTSLHILSVQEKRQEVLGVEVDKVIVRVLW